MRLLQTCSKNQIQASGVQGSPIEIVVRKADRSQPASSSGPRRIICLTIVGTIPMTVTSLSAATCHIRASCGQSGVPSARTSVAPRRVALTTILGPTIHPMSLIHSSRSVAFKSMQSPTSSAFLAKMPQCVWIVPFGFPVVPELYISITGASASTISVGTSAAPSRCVGQGTSRDDQDTCSSLSRTRTTTVCTLCVAARARSSVSRNRLV